MNSAPAAPYLVCRRACGYRTALAPVFGGCPDCRAHGIQSALVVRYDYEALRSQLDDGFWSVRGESLWHYRPLLPIQDGAAIVSLGAGSTPLVPSRRIARQLGLPNLLLKNETCSPTWSHKDRMQTVSASVARAFGYERMVTISTGNFGASLAAHGAAARLRVLVLCPHDVSPLLLRLIRSYGADVIVSDWGAPQLFLPAILERGGWFPALSARDTLPSNPFGIEGAKTIAYELARQHRGGTDAVLVPAASGDTLVGIARGFEELRLLGRIDRTPRLYGCQPAGAAALARTLEIDAEEVVVLEHPYSIATSTRGPTTSSHALAAIRASGGGAPTTTEEGIVEAMRWLSEEGFCVEPASAVPVACLADLLQTGAIGREETTVCLLTSTGIKWPETLGLGLQAPEPIPPSLPALEQALADLGLA